MIELGGRPAILLGLDAVEGAPIAGAGRVGWLVPARGPRPRRATWVAFEGARDPLDPRLVALGARDAVVLDRHGLSVDAVLLALRYGCRTFHLVDGADVVTSNARGALLVATRRGLARGLGDWREDLPARTLAATRAAVRAVVSRTGASVPAALPGGPLRIVHVVGQLGAGGAERQVVYLAMECRRAGHDVTVVVKEPLLGPSAHHAPALLAAGVRLLVVPPLARRAPLGREHGDDLPGDLLAALPGHAQGDLVLALARELARLRPHVCHAWLDEPNVTASLAALAVGIPRVAISARNVNPSHFPRLDQPWLRPSYRLLARAPRVAFIANSHAGAADYAAWSGVARARFRVVWNGLPLASLRPPTPAERALARQRCGLPADAPTLVGVFRLAPEKRPLDFVRLVAAARARVPGLVAVHVGDGPLEAEVRALARDLGLEGALRLVGRQDDVATWLRAADVSALASDKEGCPNVSLESQALGVPVVLTRGGGAPETVRDGETGFVCDVGDVGALGARVADLVLDPARARAMGLAGRTFVEANFSVERMVEATLALYREGEA